MTEKISRRAAAQRVEDRRAGKCGDGPDIPHFPYWSDARDEDVADFLSLAMAGHGRDAKFCASLAQQFFLKGEWSPKQRHYARKMYRERWEDEAARLSRENRHDWQQVGATDHDRNIHLGTFQQTVHYRCAKCGAESEVYKENNWSGD